jgi:acetyl-CoA C-acetyltransferase
LDYKGLKYSGVHSFRAGRMAALHAYRMAGVNNPIEDRDVIDGEGGRFIDKGTPLCKASCR